MTLSAPLIQFERDSAGLPDVVGGRAAVVVHCRDNARFDADRRMAERSGLRADRSVRLIGGRRVLTLVVTEAL